MFHPLGLFKKILCPRQHDCNLQNCIFDHQQIIHQDATAQLQAYDPFSAGELEEPPAKKRKLEKSEPVHQISRPNQPDQSDLVLSQRPPQKLSLSHGPSSAVPPPTSGFRSEGLLKRKTPSITASMQRPVSPPPARFSKTAGPMKVEKLIPRPVGKAPATLSTRLSFVELLYKQATNLNTQSQDGTDSDKNHNLDDQQIIKWVLDREQEAATGTSSDIYRNTMAQKVLQLKKMKPTDWKAFAKAEICLKQVDEQIKNATSPGLTKEEEIQVLRYVRTNLTGLDAHGYVTKAPSAAEIQKAKDVLKTSYGYEVCDRCGVRFQVFPGRDDQGRLTTKGECYYHWARINKGQWQKTDHITGQAQASFPCCGQPAGSEGCTQAPTHVFKVTDPQRMAALWQFEQTPMPKNGKKRQPVAFDCEMAYTTHGMEVVRVTAVSWPDNQALLDILVRPFGEILDLNTRFSGVTQDRFANALPYNIVNGSLSNTSEETESESQILRKVDSPLMARQLMFNLLAPDTPLIGHAIDNDLNTCRMIHSFVVDTVLLYPHPKGLPLRLGLKALSATYLHRSIQTGGESGHDSKEDSIATGDLVRQKVAEKWQSMKIQGWTFQDGVLVAPAR